MRIQKRAVPDPENARLIEKLVVDGELDQESEIHTLDWTIRSAKTFFALLECASDDPLFDACCGFSYTDHREPWYEYPISIHISRDDEDDECTERIEMFFSLTIDLYQWDKPYSFNALKARYKNTCKKFPDIRYRDDSEYEDGVFIEVRCNVEDRKAPLRHPYDRLLDCLQQLHLAEQALLRETIAVEPESLTATFNFPPEIRSACNQYLLYFGQFLEDLGILADTSLKEQVNNVLFTVTPRDKAQALDVIYEALNVFLHAPDSSITDEMNDQDFAHYQWKMNIFHLKGQLELAKALLLAKDVTIDALKDALQIANYQVGQTPPATEKEDEDILGGAVSITKLKGKGFTINLPRIIRKLRRKK